MLHTSRSRHRSLAVFHSPLTQPRPTTMAAPHRRFVFLCLLFPSTCINAWGLLQQQQRRSHPRRTALSSQKKKNEPDAWRDQAQQLRREIEEFEASRQQPPPTQTLPPTTVTAIPDSVWTLQYRCSAAPVQDDDDDDDAAPPDYYSGTITVRWRGDGYTDLIEQTTTTGNTNSNEGCLMFTKAWGWDIELDREQEDREYVLFSTDATVPSSSSDAPSPQRFYWQAQLDTTSSSSLRLVDGTVTVKQDVIQKDGGGGWFPFLLSPAGILAQFRSVGVFVARPTVMITEEQQ